MTTIDQRINELRRLFPLRDGIQAQFDDLVAAIVEFRDPLAIRPILDLVEDDSPVSGLMGSLLESLEVFPPEVYVPEFLEVLPDFARRSPQWARSELNKLLWSPPSLAVLKTAATRLLPEQATALRTVLNKIDTPALASARQALLLLV